MSGWVEHRSRSGHTYYYQPETEEHSWVRPDAFNGQSRQLTQEEIQVTTGGKYYNSVTYMHIHG